MSTEPALRDHKAWQGYLQPEGLVVSPAALVDAQVILDRNLLVRQQEFKTFVKEVPGGSEEDDGAVQAVPSFAELARGFLEWPDDCLFGIEGRPAVPESLQVDLPDLGETLSPTLAFQDPRPKDPEQPWLLLVKELPLATALDKVTIGDQAGWSATATQRFERLLRETRVPIGLLSTGTEFRLVYAPRGENSGSLTFPVAAMSEVAGRPILGAFDMLLNCYRLLAAPGEARLPALLTRSRDYQSRVSNELAQQVLAALYDLLRGFQAAHEKSGGKLLKDTLEERPDDIYAGMLNVLMRLVFLLYAEDRGLMPGGDLYVRNYSVHGLFERLQKDWEEYPDTIDQRYGAWAQLVSLFRAVYDGCRHPLMSMPARSGYLFDPNRFPFLDGRPNVSAPAVGDDGAAVRLPLVSDGVIYRVLNYLLVLDGERLSYKTLDVEQIGSVYESMMGFKLQITDGPSIAIRAGKAHGAPAAVNLEHLLAVKPADRAKWIAEQTDQKLAGELLEKIKNAKSIDDVLVALEKKIARHATPSLVPKDTMVLQPSDERRRSGSHYTPRKLTEPIVRKTLEPILKQLGNKPTPEQILDLKICDPAMGSGAFLVEACRQLGDELVDAWHAHDAVPRIDPDETEELHARRIIAQRCLYGVDKNPMAVDLAKLSLWLATLAKDHPFTFLDHSLRCGDSLVGLSQEQIICFHWEPAKQRRLHETFIRERLERATAARREILEAGEMMSPSLKAEKLAKADEALDTVRLIGDLIIASFFVADHAKGRQAIRDELLASLAAYLDPRNLDVSKAKPLNEAVDGLRGSDKPLVPFHWEIEFPEVFGRKNVGFDAIVGNPPFLGGLKVSNLLGMPFFGYLTALYPGAKHLCDLVAYFFRRSFSLLRTQGTLGLIATNSIAQGDTRTGGLTWICEHGGNIYSAVRRYRWPGEAAVVVSILHISKSEGLAPRFLDGLPVPCITAYLFTKGGNADPARLAGMNELFSQGTNIRSPGFLIGSQGEATTLEEMSDLLERSPDSRSRIKEYIGGEEVNSNPGQQPKRYVIYLSDIRDESGLSAWPDLVAIVRQKVKPERDALGSNPNNIPLKRRWWAYHADRRAFYEQIREKGRVLIMSQVSPHLAFAFGPSNRVYGNTLNLFLLSTFSGFASIQARPHELWARFFASSMKDDMRYTPSDCFETFPFPEGFETDPRLEEPGRAYYEFRAALMVGNNEGLTKTYNRFHDPDEASPDILELRRLHAAMDRTVLDAYGWTDIPTDCEFLLDYEEDEAEDDNGTAKKRKKKKPWRYRWPDEIRDEVLARLLDLNAKRAEEECLAGQVGQKAKTAGRRHKKVGEPHPCGPNRWPDLFDTHGE